MKKRDKYLICTISAVIIYAVASFILALKDKALPDSLTVAWYAFWGSEIFNLARIKINDKGGEGQ